jgi:uncharacterized protein YjeT (DUF2065 family)
MGMVFVLEGLPYFVLPDKIKLHLVKLLETPDSTLRVVGLLVMMTGLFLLYLGRT